MGNAGNGVELVTQVVQERKSKTEPGDANMWRGPSRSSKEINEKAQVERQEEEQKRVAWGSTDEGIRSTTAPIAAIRRDWN